MSAASFRAFCRSVGYDLEPFQRKIATAVYGPEPEVLVLLSRGEAKTTIGGLLAVEHLRTVPRPAVYLVSTSRDEARTGFEVVREYADHPALADQLVLRHLEVRVQGGGHLRVLASDARLALSVSPTLVMMDELHAFRDDALYVAMRSALHKRGGKLVIFSTAGETPEGALGKLRARALAQPHVRRSGSLTEAWGDGVRLLEWAVPEHANVDDPRVVKRACPASWVTVEQIRDMRRALPDHAFRRFICNQWVGRESAWLQPGAWQACAGVPEFEPGERVWVAVDLSGGAGRSDTAVVWVNERLHVGVEIWTGEHDPQAEVAALLSELAEHFTVQELVLDFWRAAALASEFEQRGLTVVSYPQTDSRLIPASKRLHDAVVDRRLVHPDDERLNAHVHNAVARHSRRGWRIDRRGSANTPTDNIDGLMALAMAVDRAEQPQEVVEPVRMLGWL
jgi:phage terminase large subunit-like protein